MASGTAAYAVDAAGVCWLDCTNFVSTIRGTYGASDIVVQVSKRNAGAIDSITWNGTEFVNSWDRGREYQSDATFNSRGECENPTEAGSRDDGQGATSKSLLQTLVINAANRLTTASRPAYWLGSGQISPGCGGVASTVPGQPSTMGFSKTVTIGVPSAANAIKYAATYTVPEAKTQSTFEIIAGYTPGRTFVNFWRFNTVTSVLTQVFPAVGGNTGGSPTPTILATADQTRAIGLLCPHVAGISHDQANFTEASRVTANATTKHNAAVAGGVLAAGAVKTYTCYIVLGTFANVQTGMLAVQANE